MDDDHRELLQQLFVVATEFVESAHDAATKGQSARLSANDYGDAARKLSAVERDIAALAEAAAIIAEHSATPPDSSP